MAAEVENVFNADLREKIVSSKILVVGAGGIGCEVLKNLVMSGFKDIEIVRTIFSSFSIFSSKFPLIFRLIWIQLMSVT